MLVCQNQLCPTRGPWLHVAQSKVLCGPVQVFTVVKISYILTTCPYSDDFEYDIFDAGVSQCHFITSVAVAVRIH